MKVVRFSELLYKKSGMGDIGTDTALAPALRRVLCRYNQFTWTIVNDTPVYTLTQARRSPTMASHIFLYQGNGTTYRQVWIYVQPGNMFTHQILTKE
jgi:hypothetical protein